MSFPIALSLTRLLEGGKWNDPNGGPTNCGMTQTTWTALGFKGSVLDATDSELAAAYRMLWDHDVRLHDPSRQPDSASVFPLTPEPADSVAFQFFVNVGPARFIPPFQGVLGVKMDGVLGPVTWKALDALAGKGERQSQALSLAICTAQEWMYRGLDTAYEKGLLDRVGKVRRWLVHQ